MTLEAIYFISQILAAGAIFGSLVFVGLQVRQSTEQAKKNEEALRAASAYEAYKHQSIQNHELARHPELIEMIFRDWGSDDFETKFSEREYLQYRYLSRGVFQGLIGTFHLYKSGSLEYEAFEPQLIWIKDLLATPAGRRIFEEEKATGVFPHSYLAEIGELDAWVPDEQDGQKTD